MKIASIGSGHIGGMLGKRWAAHREATAQAEAANGALWRVLAPLFGRGYSLQVLRR
ncbi:hypothetical protein [Cohnella rhizosphaerae]|uniref:Pyrroline-5-carboxylate reductase catalytic N-terminal domain-containing protein n=1 Tax=Cohnella rhizosphaerae TaxID=1457232 RepID=A0A9X4KQB9_9BACL|nr:hypothetical protein [Cohnella rhizosphaerae]MDG0809179.1 hypothetical protein [Cohnella rhizosphaerae]